MRHFHLLALPFVKLKGRFNINQTMLRYLGHWNNKLCPKGGKYSCMCITIPEIIVHCLKAILCLLSFE